METRSTSVGSPRYCGLQAVSPLGRCASGPWDGPFGSSQSASESEGLKTIYINPGGQCFGDLKGSAAELALLKSKDADEYTSNQSSENVDDHPVLDLATLAGLLRPKKGTGPPAKEKASKTGTAGGPRCSNKQRRKSNSLQQPRRHN